MYKLGKPALGRVQDAVYNSLRKSIMNLNLVPGTAISEKEVSLRYKVSRTPVREAFIHLSQEGLVRVIPQKETLVSLIDIARVKQEFFLRENLEAGVLGPFIKNSNPQYFAEMERLLEMQRLAYNRNDHINFVMYDDLFHRTFFEAAGQMLSWYVLESMSGHYHRMRLLTIRLKGIAHDVVDHHTMILKALREKDLNEAHTRFRMHIHKLDTEEELLMREYPGYFVSGSEKDVFETDFGGFPIQP
ncbi:MAG: GntR family transcriptional regulator [Treponema sp.]|jgi:DNA-binding GntR family transcriptional regulator|nr:GntR family transcriptional regulator [Treponema sp.]